MRLRATGEPRRRRCYGFPHPFFPRSRVLDGLKMALRPLTPGFADREGGGFGPFGEGLVSGAGLGQLQLADLDYFLRDRPEGPVAGAGDGFGEPLDI